MILDLETLKHVKFSFELHSDHSTMCNGYRSLCRMIEEKEGKVNENFAQPVVISSASNSDLQFSRVLNTLRENKIMVITKDDGIYIRLAGDVNKGECWMDNFVKVADC